MAQKPNAKVEKDTSERWLLTYADLMNLLLILFIILYAMSQIDVAKFNQLAASLKSTFGDSSPASVIDQGANGSSLIDLPANSPSPVVSSNAEDQQEQAVKDTISKIADKENLKGEVNVSIQERGVVISIMDKVLFDPGSADIEPASREIILKIGKVLQQIPGKQIRIEGNTDSDPINTPRFPDNQELSTARANSVLRILVNGVHLNPKMLSAVGYGEFRPLVPNTTAANKAQNRRVDIVILKDIYDKSESGNDKSNTGASGSSPNTSDKNSAASDGSQQDTNPLQ
ncbi:MAG: flagellar motor protein MotB [Bacillota bacterium]|nr:flagellar motor protein MotB [Bacillota bacterium]